MINEYIQDQLNSYYPTSRKITAAIIAEMGRNFGERGMGQVEFDDALSRYRQDDKGIFCPTWMELKHYLPDRRPWEAKQLLGITIADQNDYRQICELTSIGCTSPATLKKYKLTEPGTNYIMAASILMNCAVNELERKVAAKYLEVANLESKRIREYRAKHTEVHGEDIWTRTLRNLQQKAGRL